MCFQIIQKIAKVFEKEVNNPIREESKRQPTKKGLNLFGVVISNFFVAKDLFLKNDV